MKQINSWHRYPSPKALGHGMCKDVLDGYVIIQEKLDGSQFSFGSFDGKLKVRSRGKVIDLDVGEKMFNAGIAYVKQLHEKGRLAEGYTYSGEYFNKPKHNTLAYDRIPKNGIILFDIRYDDERYLDTIDVERFAKFLDLEVAPLLYKGEGALVDSTLIERLMGIKSTLGGDFNIEGIVIKNYNKFSSDGKVQMAKVVSEKFKEKHCKNPAFKTSNKDVIAELIKHYKSEARWQKAVQHLKESGSLELTPKDIGKLISEVKEDILSDSVEEIKNTLFKWAWPKISREAVSGLPEWYKAEIQREFLEGETK